MLASYPCPECPERAEVDGMDPSDDAKCSQDCWALCSLLSIDFWGARHMLLNMLCRAISCGTIAAHPNTHTLRERHTLLQPACAGAGRGSGLWGGVRAAGCFCSRQLRVHHGGGSQMMGYHYRGPKRDLQSERLDGRLFQTQVPGLLRHAQKALAQEQEAPERMGFNNCSGAFSLSDLSEDLLGSRSSLGEFESEVDVGFGSGSGSLLQAGQCAEDGVEMPDGGDDDLKGDGDREEDREGDNVGDSWMADFVSDLGFWLECIDMLDEQHAAAAGDRGSNRSSPSGRQARGLNGKALQEGRSWTFAFVWVGNAPGGTCLSILCLGERQGTCSRTDMTSRLPSRLLPEEEGRVLQKDCCSCSVHVLSQAGGFELCCHRCNRCSASCPHGAHLLPSKGPPVFIAC
eukprot:1153391-Pelagomonas_calceolata.AAC.10